MQIDQSASMLHQRRHFEGIWGDRIKEIESACNFSISELPQTDLGSISSHPTDLQKSLNFELASKVVISLNSFTQHLSYEGFREGMPHPYWAFMVALDAAQRAFPHFEGLPRILSPNLYVGTHGEGDDCVEWAVVPPVCTVALFESNSNDGDQAQAVLIWFQDEFGLELDDQTSNRLKSLDWDSIAVGSGY
jgi:hypothetical protein